MRGKPRKLSLTPVQREILVTIDDGGECELVALANTLRVARPLQHTDVLVLVEELESALSGLLGLGFVELCRDISGSPTRPRHLDPIESPDESLNAYISDILWNQTDGNYRWKTDEYWGASNISVCITDRGEEALRQ